ncbi:MAG: ATP-dependent Clp protease ATP-binding subunit, partial [bacterium]|nr:ATP-dependent Clp protease ATP-binding subunit [bacterium]
FGFSIIFLTSTIGLWTKALFFNLKLKRPKLKITIQEAQNSLEEGDELRSSSRFADARVYNLAEFLSFEVAKAVWRAISFSKKRKLPKISSEALLYFSLEEWPEANFIFSRALLPLKEIKKELKDYLDTRAVAKGEEEDLSSLTSLEGKGFQEIFSEDFQKVILEALKIAQRKNHQTIEMGDILISQSQIDPTFKKYLIAANLKTQDIENLADWLESLKEKIAERKKFWEYKNLAKRGNLAKQWAAGYTITLDQYSIDWTDFIKRRGFEEIIGHKLTIEKIERILTKSEINNVLLVGEPGTGRGATIQALAQRSLFGESLPNLNYKRVVELDMTALLTQIENSEYIESTLDRILREAIFAGNIILIINEFHNYIGQLARPGIIDISGVLSPYLKSPQFQIVAITTFVGLHKYIEQNPSILSLFEKVEVSEISVKDTIKLLENQALILEQKYKKFVSYPAIREIVNYSQKYLSSISLPKSAMDLLDEIMVYLASEAKEQILLPEHVDRVVSEKIQIPVGELKAKEREILLNLEKLIHQRIIDQEEAVNEVSAAMRRARAAFSIRSGPMGCFLFLGPTGVGKTETSKALAEIYFGSEQKMIRLDMSEFQDTQDIPRLIGSASEEGLLTTPVRETPFSLILLDEIEKAHPNVLNLFLQVFDEGHLTDGLGRKVDFKNSIIIATSNAGAEIIWEDIRINKKLDIVKEDLLGYLFKEGVFRPEFINRFDGVVVFKPLTKENLLDIAELFLQKLKKNLEEKNIEFVITQPLKKKITELGYNPTFGAREMRRVIQDKVENILATALLSGQLKRGDKVEIVPKDNKFELILKS